MKSQILASLKIFCFFTVLTGIIYPLMVTVFAQTIFPRQSHGSLILQNDKVIGSELIGQNFKQEKYFWARPSAVDYNPLPSGGTNLAPTSQALRDQVTAREKQGLIEDMLMASASGLDPHISYRAALSQVARIVKARQSIDEGHIIQLIDQSLEKRDFSIFGDERINVLKLNLALDAYRERP